MSAGAACHSGSVEPSSTPIFATAASLKIGNLTTPGGDDTLALRGSITVPLSPPIDPSLHGLRLLLDDAAGERALDATLPGGAGWKANRGRTAWTWWWRSR